VDRAPRRRTRVGGRRTYRTRNQRRVQRALAVGFIDGTCRIVAVVDDPQRYGFAYGTLSIHPERGEESFVVTKDGDGNVTFDIVGLSRPKQPLARMLPPIADRLQDRAVRRYLSAMEHTIATY
jgi:uncharacterized protein (UPF0548 family)